MRKSMFVLGLALIVALAGVPAVQAESHSIYGQAWDDPATGVRIQLLTVKSNDWVRGNQIATYALMTNQVVAPTRAHKSYVADPTPISAPAVSSSDGIINNAMKGVAAGMAIGGGIAGGGYLQGADKITNTVAGSVQSQGQKGVAIAKQKQGQVGINSQSQGQGQSQNAFGGIGIGGQGGQGGSGGNVDILNQTMKGGHDNTQIGIQ